MKLRRYLTVLPVMLFCLSALAQVKGAPVVVTNTTENPVPTVATGTTAVADVAARNVVRLYAAVPGLEDGAATLQSSQQRYVVPAGKRLVINYTTLNACGQPGIRPQLGFVVPSLLVNLEPHKLPFAPTDTDCYLATLAAPVYVDAGESIYLYVGEVSGLSTIFNGYFQGYLVDCGAGCTTQQ